MNINNVIKALRQSLKLQAISVYYPHARPSIPANRKFFDEITPTLKLILKVFKQAHFEAYVSRWGELSLFSQNLGLEILLRIEPNTKYMSQASELLLEKNGYHVLDVEIPRMPFVLNYFFCGTKSKWRQIPFDLNFESDESVYITFIEPIMNISTGFQGRLSSSLQKTINERLVSPNTVYAFARYATNNMTKVYGLAQFCKISESKYVRECFFNSYGAVLFADYAQGLQVIIWHKKDIAFIEKHIPQMFKPHQIACSAIAKIQVEDEEHQLLLESLDRSLLQKYNEIDKVEDWLNEAQYFTGNQAPIFLLDSSEGTSRILSVALR
jgi:hypothetical protein